MVDSVNLKRHNPEILKSVKFARLKISVIPLQTGYDGKTQLYGSSHIFVYNICMLRWCGVSINVFGYRLPILQKLGTCVLL